MVIVNLKDETGRQLSSYRLREILGLPKKLPDNTRPKSYTLGNVLLTLYPKWMVKEWGGTAKKPHRLYAMCPNCHDMIPAGRLHQHMKGKHNQ